MRNVFEYYKDADILSHYGIKGQKWGVRRFQNPDGTWTDEGKVRYGGSETKKRQKIVRLEKKWRKQDFRNERIQKKINETTKKNKIRLSYEYEYRKKGMTQKEAEIAAYKKEKTIKILRASAAIGITAIAAYVGYKAFDKNVDRFLKNGVELKRVASTGDLSVHDGFYAVLGRNKVDVAKYSGLFANELKSPNLLNNPFQKSIEVGKTGLKIASQRSGVNALREIVQKDPVYTQQLMRVALKNAKFTFSMMYPPRLNNARVCQKALDSLAKGKIDHNVYKGLVSAMGPLGGAEKHLGMLRTMLFDKLKANGFGGIQDINDKYISGYRAKMPVIIFDAASVNIKAAKELTDQEIVRNSMIGLAHIELSALSPKIIAAGATSVGAKTVADSYRERREDRIVAEYRKEHPNTKLSYTEILRNYYRNK